MRNISKAKFENRVNRNYGFDQSGQSVPVADVLAAAIRAISRKIVVSVVCAASAPLIWQVPAWLRRGESPSGFLEGVDYGGWWRGVRWLC